NERGKLPFAKKFLSEVQPGVVPTTWWDYKYAGSNRNAKNEIKSLFEGASPFDNPKPTKLIELLIKIATNGSNDIVLDFFAGIGTTGHAVLNANSKDKGSRKYILVQLPEQCINNGYESLAQLCAERMRRTITISKSHSQSEDNKQFDILSSEKKEVIYTNDFGFKYIRLDSSNFTLWDGKNTVNPEELEKQLRLYADHVKHDRSKLDILYEILLKTGFSLTANIQEQKTGKSKIFNIENGGLILCLENEVSGNILRDIMKLKPRQVICLDSAFKGNDQLKTNTVLEMKSQDIVFHTI
ncbi:MAG TPA: DNA methyltransferase, partial [Chitinophagaceae bacterium]|nr:DNA methyltransferase [Chitinophagaceae bacterium]